MAQASDVLVVEEEEVESTSGDVLVVAEEDVEATSGDVLVVDDEDGEATSDEVLVVDEEDVIAASGDILVVGEEDVDELSIVVAAEDKVAIGDEVEANEVAAEIFDAVAMGGDEVATTSPPRLSLGTRQLERVLVGFATTFVRQLPLTITKFHNAHRSMA